MNLLDTVQQVLAGVGIRLDIATSVVVLGLTLARLVAAIMLAPFLGGPSVPSQVKVGLAFAVSIILLPHVAPAASEVPQSPLVLMALLVKEVMVGAIIGFISQLVFYAVQMAGTIVDTQRGLNQITYVAPHLPGHVSALGNLQFQAALVLFLSIDGHLIFIRTLARSFLFLPLLQLPAMHVGALSLAEQAARITAGTLVIGCQLAAPVVLALFLIDVSFAALGKVAGQIRVSDQAQTLKALVGLIMVIVLGVLFLTQLRSYFAEMIRMIGDFVMALVS